MTCFNRLRQVYKTFSPRFPFPNLYFTSITCVIICAGQPNFLLFCTRNLLFFLIAEWSPPYGKYPGCKSAAYNWCMDSGNKSACTSKQNIRSWRCTALQNRRQNHTHQAKFPKCIFISFSLFIPLVLSNCISTDFTIKNVRCCNKSIHFALLFDQLCCMSSCCLVLMRLRLQSYHIRCTFYCTLLKVLRTTSVRVSAYLLLAATFLSAPCWQSYIFIPKIMNGTPSKSNRAAFTS